MAYKLPLALRRRYADNKRARYHSDPDYRIRRINEQRILRGLPTIDSLEQMLPRGGRQPNAKRDEMGRFA